MSRSLFLKLPRATRLSICRWSSCSCASAVSNLQTNQADTTSLDYAADLLELLFYMRLMEASTACNKIA